MKPVLALAVAFPVAAAAAVLPSPYSSSADIAQAANRFLDSLDDAQRGKAALPFDGEQRRDWHYIPRDNEGVPFRELTDAQKSLGHDLIRSTMSTAGYHKTTTIMFLDQILYELETAQGRTAANRDPGRYWIAVFGTPSEDGDWGWRIQGHHVSMNFSTLGNAITIASPAFFGANPHQIQSGPYAGLRALAAEEDLARELLSMLSEEQRGRAVLGTEVPSDIVLSPGREADLLGEPHGLPWSAMTPGQQEVLRRLIEEYARNVRPELAEAQLDRIDAAGPGNVHFAWMGSPERGRGHYYRIQGPTFVIEYDNAQGNHSHTVWRDLEKDFGVDLLLKHYEENPIPHEHR